MNILYVVPCNPLAMENGASVRANSVWRALRKIGDVECLVLDVWGSSRTEDDAKNNVRFVSEFSCFRNRLCRRLFPIFALAGLPIDRLFVGQDVIRKACGLDLRRFDAVVVYAMCMARTAIWKLGPTYVDVDDSFADRFDVLMAKRFRNPIVRRLVKWAYVRRQCAVCGRAEGLWVSNQKDVAIMNRVAPCAYLPNISALDIKRDDIVENADAYVCIVGTLAWSPNRVGVEWFLEKVWPPFHERFPQVTLKVIGGGAPEEFNRKWKWVPGVELCGFVEDLVGVYLRAKAVFSPLFDGGGTSMKVVEAAKAGCKIIATKVSVRGLEEEDVGRLRIDVVDDVRGFVSRFEDWICLTAEEQRRQKQEVWQCANEKFGQVYVEEAIQLLIK